MFRKRLAAYVQVVPFNLQFVLTSLALYRKIAMLNWLHRILGKNGRVRPSVDEYVGSRLEKFRTRAGLSQQYLAERIDVPLRELVKMELGKKRIEAATLFQLSELLDVAVADFFRTDGASA